MVSTLWTGSSSIQPILVQTKLYLSFPQRWIGKRISRLAQRCYRLKSVIIASVQWKLLSKSYLMMMSQMLNYHSMDSRCKVSVEPIQNQMYVDTYRRLIQQDHLVRWSLKWSSKMQLQKLMLEQEALAWLHQALAKPHGRVYTVMQFKVLVAHLVILVSLLLKILIWVDVKEFHSHRICKKLFLKQLLLMEIKLTVKDHKRSIVEVRESKMTSVMLKIGTINNPMLESPYAVVVNSRMNRVLLIASLVGTTWTIIN